MIMFYGKVFMQTVRKGRRVKRGEGLVTALSLTLEAHVQWASA